MRRVRLWICRAPIWNMHIIQPSVYRAISLASHADRQNLNVGHDPDCHWIYRQPDAYGNLRRCNLLNFPVTVHLPRAPDTTKPRLEQLTNWNTDKKRRWWDEFIAKAERSSLENTLPWFGHTRLAGQFSTPAAGPSIVATRAAL